MLLLLIVLLCLGRGVAGVVDPEMAMDRVTGIRGADVCHWFDRSIDVAKEKTTAVARESSPNLPTPRVNGPLGVRQLGINSTGSIRSAKPSVVIVKEH